jgi:hypothetical protein
MNYQQYDLHGFSPEPYNKTNATEAGYEAKG